MKIKATPPAKPSILSRAIPDGLNLDLPGTPRIPENMPLIPVTQGEVGGVAGLVVDARSLHAALRSRRGFTTWLKARIQDYRFTEDEDYAQLDSPFESNQDLKAHGGDRKSQKFTLTLGMAKELAMVEKNDVGQAVRRYFIQCERDLMASAEENQKLDRQEPALLEGVAGPASYRDWQGRPYEGVPALRHQAQLQQLLCEIPRFTAYEEYARTVAITGQANKAIARVVAERSEERRVGKEC